MPAAPVTDKGVYDPYEQPIEYLRSKGWKPLGLPGHPNTLWMDPTKPDNAHWTTEPIMVQVDRPKVNGRAGETELVTEQLNFKDGLPKSGPKPRVRHVFHPAGEPVTLAEALKIQIYLDRMEVQARETKKKAS